MPRVTSSSISRSSGCASRTRSSSSWCTTAPLANEVSEHQVVDIRLEKASHGVIRRADDRLAADVERRVEQNRYAGERLEFVQQRPVAAVVRARDGLDARRPV